MVGVRGFEPPTTMDPNHVRWPGCATPRLCPILHYQYSPEGLPVKFMLPDNVNSH